MILTFVICGILAYAIVRLVNRQYDRWMTQKLCQHEWQTLETHDFLMPNKVCPKCHLQKGDQELGQHRMLQRRKERGLE